MTTEEDLRPMCDRVTAYAVQHTGGKCPRKAVYKIVNRKTEEVQHLCAVHDSRPSGWVRFKLDLNGKAQR